MGSFISMLLINRFGRKFLLSLGILCQTMSYFLLLFGLVFGIGVLVVVGIFLYLIAFINSLGGMMFLYQVEIMPINLVPIVNSVGWGLSILFQPQSTLQMCKKGKQMHSLRQLPVTPEKLFTLPTVNHAIKPLAKA